MYSIDPESQTAITATATMVGEELNPVNGATYEQVIYDLAGCLREAIDKDDVDGKRVIAGMLHTILASVLSR